MDNFKKIEDVMLKIVLSLLVVLLLPVSGLCAIYGYLDDDGVYHMTNIRPPGKSAYRTLIEDRDSRQKGASFSVFNKNAYDDLIRLHSEANGLDPHLVKAVMIAESNGNPQALSQKGAQGLMQIMPDTAVLLDLRNPFDPEENIQAGARYLKSLYELFRGDIELVLAAYNAGPQRVIENNWAIPRISETVNYVKRVKLYYSRLKDSQ
jgi:soluble lytic murein transglycosylase-like protein